MGDFKGENNPNWKGGISRDHYHYKKLQRERYPERLLARKKLSRAVKSGKVVKGYCQVCGATDVFAHHPDYSEPLRVDWLCREHHRQAHGGRH